MLDNDEGYHTVTMEDATWRQQKVFSGSTGLLGGDNSRDCQATAGCCTTVDKSSDSTQEFIATQQSFKMKTTTKYGFGF